MRWLNTVTFAKTTKKLHAPQKLELDAALKLIAKDPLMGEAKVGDLRGVYVYKLRLFGQQALWAYRWVD